MLDRARLANLCLILLLVGLCGGFFLPVVQGRMTFPWDFLSFMYPAQRFVHEAIRSGQWPLWNPFNFLGFPIIGDPQASIFNPVYLLYHVIPIFPPLSVHMFGLLEIAQIAAAGVFTYCLGRTLEIHPSAALLAGLVYMLGGFFPSHVEHQTWVSASAWLPLLVLLTLRLLERPRAIYIPAISLVFAAMIVAGYPQTALVAAYFVASALLWRAVQRMRAGETSVALRSALILGVSLVLGGAISAVQLLPTAELTRWATRGSANFAGRVAGGLEMSAPVSLVLPLVFGSDQQSPLLGGDITHNQIYIGLGPFLLTVVALLALYVPSSQPLYGRYLNFFRLWTVLAFIGSFGASLYVYRIFEWLPLMTLFRRAATLHPFALLGLAVLVGMLCDNLVRSSGHALWRPGGSRDRIQLLLGLGFGVGLLIFYVVTLQHPDRLQALFSRFAENPALVSLSTQPFAEVIQRNAEKMLPFLVTVMGLLALMTLWRKGRPLLIFALGLVTFWDLYAFNANQIYNAWPADQTYTLGQVAMLDTVAQTRGVSRLGRTHSGGLDNIGSIIQVEELNGYNPLSLRHVVEFLRAIPSANAPMFDLTNVRYVMAPTSLPETGETYETFASVLNFWESDRIYIPAAPLDPAKFTLVDLRSERWYQVWENRLALPRFFAVSDYQVEPNPQQRLTLLAARSFEPTKALVLDRPPDLPPSGRLATPVDLLEANLSGYRLHANVFEGSTLLFMSIPFYPGWRATVDDMQTPIYIANHAFMAIAVPPGEHTIDLRFEPLSFKVGLGITVAALLICLLIPVVVWGTSPHKSLTHR